jgi:hypothetical protein
LPTVNSTAVASADVCPLQLHVRQYFEDHREKKGDDPEGHDRISGRPQLPDAGKGAPNVRVHRCQGGAHYQRGQEQEREPQYQAERDDSLHQQVAQKIPPRPGFDSPDGVQIVLELEESAGGTQEESDDADDRGRHAP